MSFSPQQKARVKAARDTQTLKAGNAGATIYVAPGAATPLMQNGVPFRARPGQRTGSFWNLVRTTVGGKPVFWFQLNYPAVQYRRYVLVSETAGGTTLMQMLAGAFVDANGNPAPTPAPAPPATGNLTATQEQQAKTILTRWVANENQNSTLIQTNRVLIANLERLGRITRQQALALSAQNERNFERVQNRIVGYNRAQKAQAGNKFVHTQVGGNEFNPLVMAIKAAGWVWSQISGIGALPVVWLILAGATTLSVASIAVYRWATETAPDRFSGQDLEQLNKPLYDQLTKLGVPPAVTREVDKTVRKAQEDAYDAGKAAGTKGAKGALGNLVDVVKWGALGFGFFAVADPKGFKKMFN